jgi:hypothetical protein
LNKSNRYATRLATSRLSKLDTFIFHWSTYIPSMSYSLLAMTFDTKTEQDSTQGCPSNTQQA